MLYLGYTSKRGICSSILPPIDMASTTAKQSSIEGYLRTKERVLASTNDIYCNGGGCSNYQADYTIKPIVLRERRPTVDNRKNNPHPCHVSHLRRLCNEPVCKVKTIITQSLDGVTKVPVSLMRHHYTLPPVPDTRPTRFGCNKSKHTRAEGIIPASVGREAESERILPACEKHTTLMTTAKPFQYITRRRRLKQANSVGNVLSCEDTPDKVPLGKSVLHNRPTRRLVASAPKTTLVVSGFDGGAPPDLTRTITGRKRSMIPTLTRFAGEDIPGWMRPY